MRNLLLVALLLALLAGFAPAIPVHAEGNILYIPYVQQGRSGAWFTEPEMLAAMTASGYPPADWDMYTGFILDATSTPDQLHIAIGYLGTNRETGDMIDGGMVYHYSVTYQMVYWYACPAGKWPNC